MQFNQQNKGSVPRKKAAAAAAGEPHHLPAQAAAVWVERGKGDPRASTQPYFQPHSSSLPLIRLSERGANTRTPLHTRYTNACLQGIVSQFFFVRLSPPPPSIVQARLGGGCSRSGLSSCVVEVVGSPRGCCYCCFLLTTPPKETPMAGMIGAGFLLPISSAVNIIIQGEGKAEETALLSTLSTLPLFLFQSTWIQQNKDSGRDIERSS